MNLKTVNATKMGVPRFARWIKDRCGDAFAITRTQHNLHKLNIDAIYIDGNSLLHPASQKVTVTGSYTDRGKDYTGLPLPPNSVHPNPRNILDCSASPDLIEKAIFEEACEVIKTIVFVAFPRKCVYIVFDGTPPLGKQQQQRQRRWKSAQERSKQSNTNDLARYWDSCSISPGTRFMDRLQSYMRWWIRDLMSNDEYWKTLNVTIDGSDVAGEGEHKIMKYIRNSSPILRQMIYGLDADIFMLSLATDHPNLFLLREDMYKRGTDPFNCNGPAFDAYWNVVYIDTISEWLNLGYPNISRNSSIIINEFVFLTFFVGNDFIPPIPFCQTLKSGLTFIYDTHRSLVSSQQKNRSKYLITSKKRISWEALKKFFTMLKEVEAQKCWEFANFQKNSSEELIDKDLIKYFSMWIGSKSSTKNQRAMYAATENYKKAYYKRANVITNSDIGKMCHNYLKILEWTNSYYHGNLVSWRYYYPYGYAPFPSDIVEYMINKNIPLNNNKQNKTILSNNFSLETPLLPFQQLMCILPLESKDILPSEYASFFDSTTSHFPNKKNVTIDMQGKEAEWQAVITLPPLELDAILSSYETISRKSKVHRRNARGVPRVFIWDQGVTQKYKSMWGTIERCNVVDKTHTSYAPKIQKKVDIIEIPHQLNSRGSEKSESQLCMSPQSLFPTNSTVTTVTTVKGQSKNSPNKRNLSISELRALKRG